MNMPEMQRKRKEREEKKRGGAGGHERDGMRGRSGDMRKDINNGMK